MPSIAQLKKRVRELEAEIYALYLAARHQATPWYAKMLVAGIVAYAISPIDLIPDFIPVLGLLDDLILLPLGIALAIRLVPPAVMSECRLNAPELIRGGKPVSRTAGTVIIGIWIGVMALLLLWVHERLE